MQNVFASYFVTRKFLFLSQFHQVNIHIGLKYVYNISFRTFFFFAHTPVNNFKF